MFPSDPTADSALFHYFFDGENPIRRENRKLVWHLIMKLLKFTLSREGQMWITAGHFTPTPTSSVSSLSQSLQHLQSVIPIFSVHVDNIDGLETRVTGGSGWQWTKIWPGDDEYGPGDDYSDNQMYTYSVLWQVLEKFNNDTKPIDIGVEWVLIEVDTHNDTSEQIIELLDSKWRNVEVRSSITGSGITLQFLWRGLDQYHGNHQRLPIHV